MPGYRRPYGHEIRFSPPLWRTQLAEADLTEPTIGFRNLLELRLVHAFARHGVDLRVIRATAGAARENFAG